VTPADSMIVDEVIVPLLRVHPDAEAKLWELLSAKYGRNVEVLTAKEFASRLKIDPDTAAKWARAGRIPTAQKVGREWRIPENAEVLGACVVGEASELPAPARPRRTQRFRSAASEAMRTQARAARASKPVRQNEETNERAA
jgi:excisionase family DNA binding protein